MTDKQLLENLSRLGLPMMEPGEGFDANQTLAEVVQSRDTRLWEGFPVLLANAAKDYRFDAAKVMDKLVDDEKVNFNWLLLLSLALYENYHLSFFWANEIKSKFHASEKTQLKQLRTFISHNESFTWHNNRFSPERLKGMFELYFEKDAEKNKQKADKHEELSLEYALSQVFSPKQKELFKKKLDGLVLTKTEKEYYSRSVKRKVAALANSQLHRLAQKLMEY